MEIPYTVKARPDTGLWNAKIGIWLFLASEVMLFGGLFSAYIFLRLGASADPLYHWPEGNLKVLPGFINTLVLIGSSVTVLLAWIALKQRDWKKFQLFMAITIGCALAFMCIKAYEYSGKIAHYGLTLNDGTVVSGHIVEGGNRVSYTNISSIEIPFESGGFGFLDSLTLGAPVAPKYDSHGHDDHAHDEKHEHGGHDPENGEHAEAPAGEVMFKLPNGETGGVSELKKAFKAAKKEAEEGGSFTVAPEGQVSLTSKPKGFRMTSDSAATLKSKVKIKGERVEDAVMLAADHIDLRNVAEPLKSKAFPLLGNEVLGDFVTHRDEQVEAFEKKYPGYKALEDREGRRKALEYKIKSHPVIDVDRETVTFMSNHTPKYNTFYAIYFVMTGLHGLHVIGGAIVLGYFLFRGREMFEKEPERMANRVEVGGLFWHFVDLVWIFLFPIMYLL